MIPFFIALPHFHRQCEHVSAFFSASRQSFTSSFSVFVNGRLLGSNVFPLSVSPFSSTRHSPRLFMQVEVKSLISSWKIVKNIYKSAKRYQIIDITSINFGFQYRFESHFFFSPMKSLMDDKNSTYLFFFILI